MTAVNSYPGCAAALSTSHHVSGGPQAARPAYLPVAAQTLSSPFLLLSLVLPISLTTHPTSAYKPSPCTRRHGYLPDKRKSKDQEAQSKVPRFLADTICFSKCGPEPTAS